MFADFLALPREAHALLAGAVVFIIIRAWLGAIGAWPSPQKGAHDGSGSSVGDGGDGGCD